MTKFYDIFKNVNGKADMKSHTVQYERLRDRVVHAHRTSYPSGWLRGLGELNPKPHLWIFISFSVGSSPRSKSFTSATVRILVSTEKKSGRNLDKIGTTQLQSFIEITTNSSFWWVNRSVITHLPSRTCIHHQANSFYSCQLRFLTLYGLFTTFVFSSFFVPQCKLPGHPYKKVSFLRARKSRY